MRLAAEHGAPVVLCDRLIARALEYLPSDDREEAADAADGLVALCDAGVGDIPRTAAACLEAPNSWSRLAAWALVLRGGPETYTLDALRNALLTLPQTAHHGFRRGLDGLLDIGDNTEIELAESLVLLGGRQILERCSEPDADDVLAGLADRLALAHIDFPWRLEALFRQHGRTYATGKRRELRDWWNHPEHDAASRLAKIRFLTPLTALTSSGDQAPPAIEKMYELAAFLAATEHREQPVSDAWDWRTEQNPESLAATITTIARLTGLPLSRLGEQARVVVGELESSESPWDVFIRLPHVDHPKVDWAAAARLGVDAGLIEPTLYHLSDFAVKLAAQVLNGALSDEAIMDVAERALANGKWATLLAGAYLAQRGGQDRAIELILQRLDKPLDRGCDHLYRALTVMAPAWTARARPALRAGLMAQDINTALRAAEWALQITEQAHDDGRWLSRALKDAYAHWRTHELPMSAEKATPVSPRRTLLKALWRLQPPSDAFLIELLSDLRADVSDLGRTTLVALASSHIDVADRLVSAVASGRVEGALLGTVLRNHAALSSASVVAVLALLRDADPRLRHAATGILSPHYVSSDAIEEAARHLTRDASGELRAEGFRLLRGLNENDRLAKA